MANNRPAPPSATDVFALFSRTMLVYRASLDGRVPLRVAELAVDELRAYAAEGK